MKKHTITILIIVMLIVGIGIFSYPMVSNYLSQQNQSDVIQSYADQVKNLDTTQLDEQRELAKVYNNALNGIALRDPFIPGSGSVVPDNYMEIMNINGVMGYIEIPKIDVNLPIYHGTSESVLQKGIGHMDASAFPIGGEGYHAVLTGHRALPTARLFTDLDRLEIGDIFYLYVLEETLTYQVDQILVVEPSNTDPLRPIDGEDHVTLITCTPYAVNTHRLFVRGVRIPNKETEEKPAINTPVGETDLAWITVAVAGAVLVALVIILWSLRKRNRKQYNAQNNSDLNG